MKDVRKLVLKGADVRLVVHKYDDTNLEIIEKFKKIGMKVRYYNDWGFHMVIYDGKRVLMTLDNPDSSESRVNIDINNRGLSKAMQDYFYHIWNIAIPL